jgi:hypothetical protein
MPAAWKIRCMGIRPFFRPVPTLTVSVNDRFGGRAVMCGSACTGEGWLAGFLKRSKRPMGVRF